MIALMGAAGRVGGKVASLLLQRGQKIRVLEHRRRLDELAGQGAHVVSGDAIDVDTLRELFDGADAALVSLPENVADPEFVVNRSRISSAIARALSERRVPHVVALSSLGVDREDIVGPPAGLREFEHALFLLQDANVLALRSAFYMENLLANLPLIEAQKINGSAIKADLAIPMVATRDVAQEAADRLGRRDFTGHQAKLVLGPEDVSMREATRLIGSRLGNPELPYVQFPPTDMKQGLIGGGMSEEVASLLVDMQLAVNEGKFTEGVERTSESATATQLEALLDAAL